nr:hypothetical protein [Tanacetum cinerariifolium]
MSSITAQQTKLDLELVPKEKRLEIKKLNERLNLGKKQREPTFQVVLDPLALTPCYSAFLTTTKVLEVYMHQFQDSIHKYDNSYRFRMDKKKKFDLNLEIFKDIFHICPRFHGLNFDELPTDEDIVSFFRVLGHTREIKSIIDDGIYYKKNVDYVELLWEDFTYLIDNRGHKNQDKMYYPRFTKVIIHYFLTKDKTVFKRNKIGMHNSRDDYLINTLRFVPAKEESQIYGALLPKSMTRHEMLDSEHETNENETGSESDQEGNEEEVEDDEKEKDDKFVKTPSISTDDEDGTNDESKVEDKAEGDEDKEIDYTTNQFDDDVNVRLNEPVDTNEWFIQKEGTDANMIYVHHPTILTIHYSPPPQTTPKPPPTTEATNPLSLLPNFAFVFQFNNRILPKEVSNFAPPVIKSMVTKSLEHAVLSKESSQPKSTYEAAASLIKFKLKKILIDKMDQSQSYLTATEHRECYDRLIKSYDLDKSLFSTYDKVYLLKRSQKDKDKDEDPFAGSDRGLKKRKTSKEKLEFEITNSKMPQDQEENLVDDDDEEHKRKVVPKRDWFTKPKQP